MTETSTAVSDTLPHQPPRREWLRLVLRPGRLLMQNLRMPAKLAIVAASLVVPLFGLMAVSIADQLTARRAAVSEQAGVATLERLMPLIVETQKHRGLTHRVLSGDGTALAPREDTRRAMTSAAADLDKHLAAEHHFRIDDRWPGVQRNVRQLVDGALPPAAYEAFALHSQVIEQLELLVALTAERSGLVLDPEPRAYFLMDVTTSTLVPLIETAAVARGLGAGLLTRGSATAAERATVLGQAGMLQRGIQDVGNKLGALERAGGEAPGSWPQPCATPM